MTAPRVTVICLCYNQAPFVKEAIHSVLSQSHPNVQLLVVDDASSDDSVAVIKECLAAHPQVRLFTNRENKGNCRAFNQALLHAEGDYLIDLAADDVLLPHRISRGVQALEEAGQKYGVNFSDASWINEAGEHLYFHADRFPHASIPQGNVYRFLIERFFICSPSMMFRRSVIDQLGGYDETLAYEDFDFWIRSSRDFHYCYTPEVLVKKRVVRNSMSQKQFSISSRQQYSTFRICEKIMVLNRKEEEKEALRKRILYEMRVCLRLFNFPLLAKYISLYRRNQRSGYL